MAHLDAGIAQSKLVLKQSRSNGSVSHCSPDKGGCHAARASSWLHLGDAAKRGPSYQQPIPANGGVGPILFPVETGFEGMSMGFQAVASRNRIREHSHGEQIEFQICFRSQGRTMVDGNAHPLAPSAACFLGYGLKQETIYES